MVTPRQRTCIRVSVYLTADHKAAIGIVEQQWRGATRVDRRLAAARPFPLDLEGRPSGVPEDLWLAYRALEVRVRAWGDPLAWRDR